MREGRILWVILLAIVLAACCCAVTVAGVLIARGVAWGNNWAAFGNVEFATEFERTFPAQDSVRLTLDVPLGDVTIQAGAADRVMVRATLRTWGRTQAQAQALADQLSVQAEQVGQQIRVTTSDINAFERQPDVSRAPEVELLITVPSQTALAVETTVGRLSVTGLRGDVSITADVGEVLLDDVLPATRIEVSSRVGNIELRGPLAAGAAYDLASDVGRIALRVPADSMFTIVARSDLGDVALGFPLVGSSERELVGKEVRGAVGAAPTTTLTLRSRVGAVSVQPLP